MILKRLLPEVGSFSISNVNSVSASMLCCLIFCLFSLLLNSSPLAFCVSIPNSPQAAINWFSVREMKSFSAYFFLTRYVSAVILDLETSQTFFTFNCELSFISSSSSNVVSIFWSMIIDWFDGLKKSVIEIRLWAELLLRSSFDGLLEFKKQSSDFKIVDFPASF